MNQVKLKRPQVLKICCSFIELADKGIEKDFAELFWWQLERSNKICKECQ